MFRETQTVQLLSVHGSDRDIVDAAKVLVPGLHCLPDSVPGIISYLMQHRHGSPFEHTQMRFYVECPIAICREFERHRIGFSFQDEVSLNVESGRYSELSESFYTLPDNRPIKKGEGFKHSRPKMETSLELVNITNDALESAYTHAWATYQGLLACGVPREVARFVLPVGIYTKFWVSCNVRAMCHFLSLRTQDARATIESFPQWEIQQVAAQLEEKFAGEFPHTYNSFNVHGRIGP